MSFNIYGKILHLFRTEISSTSVVRHGIKNIDSILLLIEKTAKWSFTSSISVRPCGWIPFLIIIISLRLIQAWFLILSGNSKPLSNEAIIDLIVSMRNHLKLYRIEGLKYRWYLRKKQQSSHRFNMPNLLNSFKSYFTSKFEEMKDFIFEKISINRINESYVEVSDNSDDDNSGDENSEETDSNSSISFLEYLDLYENADTDANDPDYTLPVNNEEEKEGEEEGENIEEQENEEPEEEVYELDDEEVEEENYYQQDQESENEEPDDEEPQNEESEGHNIEMY